MFANSSLSIAAISAFGSVFAVQGGVFNTGMLEVHTLNCLCMLKFKMITYVSKINFNNLLSNIKGAGGGYLGVRSWKMSLSSWLIEGVMVVI